MARSIPLVSVGQWVAIVGKNLEKVAHAAAVEAALHTRRDIQAGAIPGVGPLPVNRALYKAAWKDEKTPRGARIYNRQYPQAPIIEFGVPPDRVKVGRAMIDALREWVAMKGISGGKRGEVAARSLRDEVLSAAWAIAKSIKKHGLFRHEGGFGLHVIDHSVPVMIKAFKEAFAKRAKAASKSG